MKKPSLKRKGSSSGHSPRIREFANKNFVTINVNSTIKNAIHTVRTSALRDNIFYIYVTHEDNRLCGVVSIRNLLLSHDEEVVANVYSPKIVTIDENLPINEAYSLFSKSKFLSLPLVNAQGNIVGIVPAHELVKESGKEVSELFEERSRGELFELLGIKAEHSSQGIFKTAQGRLPWLLINIVGGLFSAAFIHGLSGNLPDAVHFLAFLPILLIVSESIGMQSASMMIANIHRTAGKARFRDVFFHESIASILVGAFCGLLVGGIVLLWKLPAQVAGTLVVALPLGAFGVSVLGNLTPQIFHRLRIDPRIAAGPVVLALADSGVLLMYLLLARWMVL